MKETVNKMKGTSNYTVRSAGGAKINVQLLNKCFRVVGVQYDWPETLNYSWRALGVNNAWNQACAAAGFGDSVP